MTNMDDSTANKLTPATRLPTYGSQFFLQQQPMLYNPLAFGGQSLSVNNAATVKSEKQQQMNVAMPSLYNMTGLFPQLVNTYGQAVGMPMQNAYNLPNSLDMVNPFPVPSMQGLASGATALTNSPTALKPTQPTKKQAVATKAVESSKPKEAKKDAKQPGTKLASKTVKKRRRVSVKLCHVEGCSKLARSTTMFCAAHGGGRRCMTPNCTKAARGATSFCIAHGGGRRCRHHMCTKSAQGSTYFCIAHGGGRRCKNQDCTKSARGPAGYCKAHGGGRKCAHANCQKSAAEGASFCRPHGGGVKCCHYGCPRAVKKNQSFCAEHQRQFDELKTQAATAALKTQTVVPLNSIKTENLNLKENKAVPPNASS